MSRPRRPTAARGAVEVLIGWPLAASFGVLAAAVGATVVGIGLALRMLSSMPAVARLGRPVEQDGRQPAWLWRC